MTYSDPFRDATITPARIDAGVDYCGSGPVHPIGDAIVTNVGRPSGTSTFGTDMPVYQLLDGPGQGKFVFFDEHCVIEPGYRNGDHVSIHTVLYRMTGCIEIGWSDGVGSMAWNSGAYSEGQLSALGRNFSDLLVALGCVGGLTLGRPVTGSLPAGWPEDWSGEMGYEDFKKGAQLYKDQKHLPGNANADVKFGWNFAQRSANLPDTSSHVHNVTVNGTTVQTSRPD